MSTKTANLLGFYYLIFQGYPNAYAKCWVDGNEDWTFIPKTDLLDYTQKEYKNPLLWSKMNSCLEDMNIYVWDVTEEKISKIKPTQDNQSLKELISENIKSLQKTSLVETQEVSWNTTFSNNLGSINNKKYNTF